MRIRTCFAASIAGASTPVLIPVFPDGFRSGAGWVLVRRDASGRVIGLSVNQDRVWDLRFVRQSD